jgi:hypothetical protein
MEISFLFKIILFSFLGISREEATILGSQRREELRRQRDRDSTTFGRLKTLLQVCSKIFVFAC